MFFGDRHTQNSDDSRSNAPESCLRGHDSRARRHHDQREDVSFLREPLFFWWGEYSKHLSARTVFVLPNNILLSFFNVHNSGVVASIGVFCVFGMLQFRDSLLLRPHPALWRVVLSLGVVYQLFLVFLLFQVTDKSSIHRNSGPSSFVSTQTKKTDIFTFSSRPLEQARC